MWHSNTWTCLDVHNCTASLTCSKTLISIIQLGDVFAPECSAGWYFPRQNLSSAYPIAGENRGARVYFELKQLLPCRNEQSLKPRSGIFSKPSYIHYIDPPWRAVAPSYLIVASPDTASTPGVQRSQLTQFKDILWPQKLVCILDPSFVLFSLSWLRPFFPRADFYSQISQIQFF